MVAQLQHALQKRLSISCSNLIQAGSRVGQRCSHSKLLQAGRARKDSGTAQVAPGR